MENKNSIEIGYLQINSWEHFAVTGERYCHNVNQLEWILPDASTGFFKSLLTLQQEVFLSDCISLSPLVDKHNSKRNIYIKSNAFKKPLTAKSKEFFENKLPAASLYLDCGEYYFPQFFKTEKLLNYFSSWDEFVLNHSGYSTGRQHTGHQRSYSFWVPESDEKIDSHYSISWQKHHFHDEILEQIFGKDTN